MKGLGDGTRREEGTEKSEEEQGKTAVCVMNSFKQYFFLGPGLLSLEQTKAWLLWEPDSSSGGALVGGAELNPPVPSGAAPCLPGISSQTCAGIFVDLALQLHQEAN